jgi:glycosyltransferase involved in cell wall biosynthesis
MPARLLIATTVDATLEGFLVPFADHFRSRGWTVDAAAAGASGNPAVVSHFDRVWEMGWSRRPLDGKNLEAAGQIREMAREGRYNIVHVHTPVASFLTRFALKDLRARTGLKVVYTAHGFHCHPGGDPVKNRIFATLERTASKWTDALVVINHEDERLARRLGLAGKGKLYYMPGIGIDLAAYSRESLPPGAVEAVERELGLEPDGALFLTIAAFDPGKKHADLLRAFKLVHRPGIHLALAGIGPTMEAMRTLTSELGLDESVHFLGQRSDVPALLAASTALVHPSAREGLPRSIMEAMAMRTPVIGTSIRGTGELLSGGAGWLVDVGDVDGLADAMSQALSDAPLRQTCAARARIRVSRYALPRVIALHDEMYDELLRPPLAG